MWLALLLLPDPPLSLAPTQERFPEYEFAAGAAEEAQERVNNSRVQRELGLAITPVRETVLDMAATLLQLGLAQPKRRQA